MGAHAPLFEPFERSVLAIFLCEQSWRKVFADTTNFFSREFSLRGDDDNITDTLLEPLNSYLFPQHPFLLSKIYDGRCSTETFLKTATLSVLVWAYPRKMKTRNGNFKKKNRHFASTVLLWKYCRSYPFTRIYVLVWYKHAHSFCRCVPIIKVIKTFSHA